MSLSGGNMNINKKTTKLVLCAMLIAISFLLGFTPIGMIVLPPPLLKVTTVHIPTIIATLALGLIPGLILSLVFGLISFIHAIQAPVGLTAFFLNPAIAFLPRLMIPLSVYFINKLIGKYIKKDAIKNCILAIVGSISNTFFTLFAIYIVYNKEINILIEAAISGGKVNSLYLNNPAKYLLLAIAVPNGSMEALASAIIVPTIIMAIKRIRTR